MSGVAFRRSHADIGASVALAAGRVEVAPNFFFWLALYVASFGKLAS
jgi:hypothetical protein